MGGFIPTFVYCLTHSEYNRYMCTDMILYSLGLYKNSCVCRLLQRKCGTEKADTQWYQPATYQLRALRP